MHWQPSRLVLLFSMFFFILLAVSSVACRVATCESLLDTTDQYIVSLKDGVNLGAHVDLVQALYNTSSYKGVLKTFNIVGFQAYSAHLDPSTATELGLHPDVEAVDDNAILTLQTTDDGNCDTSKCPSGECPKDVEDRDENDPDLGHLAAPPAERRVLQRMAPYNLHRISHRGFSDTSTYWYVRTAGAGTYAYVLDTGIDADHSDLGGRVTLAYNALGDSRPATDDHGHGTYIAGIMGGKWYGVAKKTNLISVKMLKNGETNLALVLAAYEWAVNDITRRHRVPSSVINISVGGGAVLQPLNTAINAAFAQGIVTVVPAGNEGQNAARISPACAKDSIAVGATNERRVRLRSSNWGPAVQIFAPGYKVCSDWPGPRGGKTRKRSGTGAAGAHVAGLVVYFRSLHELPNAEVTWSFVKNAATRAAGRNAMGAPDIFAYNLSGR